MPHTDDDEIDDILEKFIVEADLAGSWLERHFMPPRLMFWRQKLDFSRESLAKLTPVIAETLAPTSPPDALEEVARRVAQYLGETIQAHARSFWQRTDGRFELRIERATGRVDVLEIAEPIARLILAVRRDDPKAADLLGEVFDDAVRDGAPPIER
ncbi:hypothetical protein OV090_12030 [Nannocystis sp. RBIL2]|uniref:hypothetical protein n=1 Tax=Nannocystis sp. RBIL2 TaxID=2996788 RepID=UPI00226F0ED1|nr:hypothetical protein [Nannocystis sp. RBIL2]MCY1065498.1 hypothetical protein [Nannocystis sp. RBIL2]